MSDKVRVPSRCKYCPPDKPHPDDATHPYRPRRLANKAGTQKKRKVT